MRKAKRVAQVVDFVWTTVERAPFVWKVVTAVGFALAGGAGGVANGLIGAVLGVAVWVVIVVAAAYLRGSDIRVDVEAPWGDEIGRPQVTVWPDGFLRWIWARATVRITNLTTNQVVVEHLYLEILGPSYFHRWCQADWLVNSLVAKAPPQEFGLERWDKGMRVNLVIPPNVPAWENKVQFAEEWGQGDRSAPPDPKTVRARVVCVTQRGRAVSKTYDFAVKGKS